MWGRPGLGRPAALAALAALTVLAIVLGCAARTERRTRRAWEKAARGGADEDPGQSAASGSAGSTAKADHAPGWRPIDAIVERACQALAQGAGNDDIARLADTWCAQAPTPLAGAHGEVRVCMPEPALAVAGHSLSLELGGAGVIGLVASDLSDAQSRDLLKATLAHGRHWCHGSWTAVGARSQDAHQEFHTCAVDGGSTLAVGRLPTNLETDLWQVSVVVIGVN